MRTRICVIGAGPGGLGVMRALQSLNESDYEVVCYERYDTTGGQWNFKGLEGIESDGLPVHSSMYHNLRINGPKQGTEHPEHLFPECEDTDPDAFYADVDHFYNYFKTFAEKFNLYQYINFKTWVQSVTFDEASEKFNVRVKSLETFQEREETPFDYIVVATGRFSEPNIVSYPGEETFTGEIFHSKYLMDASRTKGKRVLLVGASYSCEDICVQCLLAGAEKVTVSYRSRPMDGKPPKEIVQRPILTEIKGSSVSFSDGSSEDFDMIIYCTGYIYHFPFMEESIRLHPTYMFATPLYKQCMLPSNQRVFYISMQVTLYTLVHPWLTGHFIARVLTGNIIFYDLTYKQT
ncbi:trimethylamine monooxygenase-like [Convolutriloba macropyga]|uniref:trimethylamine monooxygenase-like n=1 Tax=Convolutriloba macropyga TaxID=536237 RepID=UPI003F5272E0